MGQSGTPSDSKFASAGRKVLHAVKKSDFRKDFPVQIRIAAFTLLLDATRQFDDHIYDGARSPFGRVTAFIFLKIFTELDFMSCTNSVRD